MARTVELPTAMRTGDPLLTAKITVPGTPDWLVARPRLNKLIAQGARGPVTAVTGPPGAGKSMALALWASGGTTSGPVAWITIDDYDNRPRVFWSYVVAALQRAGVAIPAAMSATARRYVVDHEFLLRFAALMAEQDPPVTLVLDDLHLLTNQKILDNLAYILRNAAPSLRLVVAARFDPLLPLHRYRLTGELTEIPASDLAFTIPESRLLMAQHGVTLSAESLERLTRRAEGWAAIMRLAAISMDGHCDPDQFVKELVAEDSAVAGYLVEEVLNAQPGHVRDFLLRTSVVDRISEDLAAELADDEQDTVVLPDLARANALIHRDDGGWYRYPSMLAAVLRLKLRREDPDRVPDLHLRAARWHRRNGSLIEAVRHAASADNWQFAARTVLDDFHFGQLLQSPGNELLLDGFRHMPRNLSWTEPQPLLVAAAIDFARAQDSTSMSFLAAAEGMLRTLPAEEEIPSRLAASLLRVAMSRRIGDLETAAAAVEAAQVLVGMIPQDQLARHPGIQAQMLAGRGAVEFWSGHFEKAAGLLEAGLAIGDATESERADCLGHLALLETVRGRLSRATELAADAMGGPDGDTDRPAGAASQAAEVALAAVHLERNELSRSRRWQKRAQDALRARPDKLLSAVACLAAARHSLAEGRAKAALEMVGQARQGWSPPTWLEQRLLLLDSWACAATGDFRSAIDIAMQAGPETSLDATAALARARLAAGDPRAAAQVLAGAPSSDEETGSARLAAWLVDAQLNYRDGDHVRGRRSLEHALRLGQAEQLRLPFVMEQNWLRPVLRRDPELAQPYRRLLEPQLVSPDWIEIGQPAGQADPLIVEPLSERERQVLEHVSAMASTAEIAAEMYISVNTVKTHLKSIYRKLAVGHRSEAVRRAREFGLL